MSRPVSVCLCLVFLMHRKTEPRSLHFNQEGPLNSLPDSAIGHWLQKHNMMRRICHRATTGTVHTGIGHKINVISCQTSLVAATRNDQELEEDGKLCPGTNFCTASLAEVKTVRSLSDVRDVTSALSCTCTSREKKCQRIPSEQVFFRGTKFETRVDVGQCVGKCLSHGARDVKCRSTSSKTVTIMGPNGARCVEVIQSCGCERKCYRASHNEAVQIQLNNTTMTEIIDVGRCVGTCSGHVKGECLLWINNPDESGSRARRCVIHTKTRQKGCYPESTRVEILGDKRVTVVESCACR
ncbi:uncharacterized protein LOC113670981 [Pocillopora damicornis]|uniref:uncharacterized protein LOC113670981 n=1 Tax=Pocillopora damicornis TaxID=46731 RepID=UPI000F556971|nr:uncharacterized protein LOC113670981 [Pocillopora damicornis]